MSDLPDPYVLPEDLPVPEDDGAAAHLEGATVPSMSVPATSGGQIDVSTAAEGTLVLYLYPRTGRPGEQLPSGWDRIPGARGCTPQSCGFRDHFAELKRLGVAALYGLSPQDTAYQREGVGRLPLPFAGLTDAELGPARAMRLPTFTADGMTLIKRMAW